MHRRVSFLLFTAGWGANHFAPMLLVYRRELGLSPAALGLLFGAYALGLVPGLLFAGKASDAGRRRVVLPAAMLAVVASLVFAALGRGFAMLLAGRLLYGLAMGAMMGPGSVWMQELSPPGAGPRRATLALSAGFGGGPLVTALLAELAPRPMLVPYVVHAIAMTLAVVLVRPVPETSRPRARASVAPSDVIALARLAPMAPWVFAFAAVGIVIGPGVLRPHLSRPILFSGFVIAVTLATGMLVQPFRVGRRPERVGLAVGAAGILVAAEAVATHAPYVLFAAAPLLGAGYGLVVTEGLRALERDVPAERRGGIVGAYYVLTYVGFALPFVHAVAARSLGDVLALRAWAVLALASLALRVMAGGRERSRR